MLYRTFNFKVTLGQKMGVIAMWPAGAKWHIKIRAKCYPTG